MNRPSTTEDQGLHSTRPLPPTILVTGASGFIGSHLIDRLVQMGIRPRCLLRPTSSKQHLPTEAVEVVYGDLATGDGVSAAVAGVDLVFHLAGAVQATTEAEYDMGTAEITANVVKACCRLDPLPNFIHVSSLAAIGPSTDGSPCTEATSPHPVTCYGRSKLRAEYLVRTSSLAPRAAVVRPPVVYGGRDRDLLPMIRSAAKGHVVALNGWSRKFSIIYVRDLIDGLITVAETPRSDGAVYFLANAEPITFPEICRTMAKVLRRKVRLIAIPLPRAASNTGFVRLADRLQAHISASMRDQIVSATNLFWVCDSSRAENELAFHPRTPFQQGIEETFAWYMRAGWIDHVIRDGVPHLEWLGTLRR